MNNETNRSEWNDALTQFEQMLRSQSFGPGPSHRGELMYECGYAAGAAAARKKTHGATTRWRVVSLVASVLACVSLSSHYFPPGLNRIEQVGIDKQLKPSQQHSLETSVESAPDAWITLLSRDRQADRQTAGILRASGTTLDIMKPNGLDDRLEPVPFETQSTPLRPTDFPLFFKGTML